MCGPWVGPWLSKYSNNACNTRPSTRSSYLRMQLLYMSSSVEVDPLRWRSLLKLATRPSNRSSSRSSHAVLYFFSMILAMGMGGHGVYVIEISCWTLVASFWWCSLEMSCPVEICCLRLCVNEERRARSFKWKIMVQGPLRCVENLLEKMKNRAEKVRIQIIGKSWKIMRLSDFLLSISIPQERIAYSKFVHCLRFMWYIYF